MNRKAITIDEPLKLSISIHSSPNKLILFNNNEL